MRRDDLEEVLHDAFDHEHLAIYAEELQREGDPRGELIALDLRSDVEGETEPLVERRRQLHLELLGQAAATHPLVRCRYGFVDLMFPLREELRQGSFGAFSAVLNGPFAAYVRDVTFSGDGMRLRELMNVLGQRTRPFLTRLALEAPHEIHYVDLPREVAARVAGVLPRLTTLEAIGRRAVPSSVEFPTVRKIVSHCYDAVFALCANNGGPPCFPRAESVNFRTAWSLQALQLERLLPPAQLPAVRELDISRCSAPIADASGYDVFRFLRGSAIAPQIERLRVPRVDGVEQAVNLQAAIDRMPGLVEIRIPGTYPLRAEPLRHPTAAIRSLA